MNLKISMKSFSLAIVSLINFSEGYLQPNTESTINPIAIDGKHFVDSVTMERFLIRGIDYQPGGASSYDRNSDPLSDTSKCARDVYLMQQLGINTLRVYTVNPQLNHDDCMTMLAAAGIYLVLDVNSPLVGESINRYEPWTTYTPEYLRHVFEVVDQFSRYNNTLGFFIGNEIINDDRSASVSPPFIKAVARDVKDYMFYNCPRMVPIGYSAADDLKYRTQLPHYLACGDSEITIDFYGVNSYQWCGNQTMHSSGYDVLIKDHRTFEFPIFFSEFGCNHIQPRIFQEVGAIFSPEMTSVFDGGLVYELTQEPNNYGLVEIDTSGNVQLLEDFFTLQSQYKKLFSQSTSLEGTILGSGVVESTDNSTFSIPPNTPKSAVSPCKSNYPSLNGAAKAIPDSFGTDMIRNGVHVARGKYIPEILANMPTSAFDIYDDQKKLIVNPQVKVVKNFSANIRDTYKTPYQAAVGKEKARLQDSNKRTKNNSPKYFAGDNYSLTSLVLLLQLYIL